MSIFSDDYILGIIENINNPPASISSIGSECVNDKSYYFDNSKRPLKYLFQYTISGYGTVEHNGNIYRVGPGQGFFLKWPTESKYYYDEGNGTEPWQFLYIILDGAKVEDYYSYVTEQYGHIYNLLQTSPSISALSDMYRMAQKGEIKDSFTSERLAFDFVCKLCYDCSNNETEYINIVLDAIDLIKSEYASLEGVTDISNRLGVTQSYLSRIFAANTGISPVKYLNKVKIQAATDLLINTSLSIEDISQKCGFSCGNYFCKVFRNSNTSLAVFNPEISGFFIRA